MLTEFGPVGHWEVRKTSWGAPIEPTSRDKASSYYSTNNIVIEEGRARPRHLRLRLGPEAGDDLHVVRHVPRLRGKAPHRGCQWRRPGPASGPPIAASRIETFRDQLSAKPR